MKNRFDAECNVEYIQEEYGCEMQRIYKEENPENFINKLIRMIITNNTR